jgi:hypothetical protein
MDKSIIEKLRKLIQHQESAEKMGSVEEAEAFALKIQELLAKYNLSKSDLKQEDVTAEIIEVRDVVKVPGIGGMSNLEVMKSICKWNWCKVYIMGNKSNNEMMIVGSPENIEICRYIHSSVMKTFLDIGKHKYKERQKFYDGIKIEGVDTFMRAFLSGCALGLDLKLSEGRQKFENANISCKAIVRMNEIAVTDYVYNKYGKPEKGRRSSVSDVGGAYEQGVQVGRNVQINKGLNQSKPVIRKMID